LKRVLEDISGKERHPLVAMLAGTKVSGVNMGKGVLLTRAKQRLQETLLKGIFGDDGEQFLSALQMPESVESWEVEPSQYDADEGQNFVETVWSAVGWDLVFTGWGSIKEITNGD
jgi:hypothetical protein